MDRPVAIENSTSKTQHSKSHLETKDDHESDSEEYETDLEDSFKEEKDFHKTQEEIYLQTCQQLDIPPVSRFLRGLRTNTVDLQHYGIGDNGVVAVSNALARNITVTKLNLCDNGISHIGTVALAQMLKDNGFIAQLDVSENRLGTKGVESIGEMLNENLCLQNLGLANCGLHERDMPKLLLQASRIHICVLNLKCNELGDEGAIILGSFLSSSSSLEVLDLSWNAIHLRGVAAIAKGLKENRVLQNLDISRNSILNEGATEIGEVLAVNKSLQVLDVSNCGFNEIGAEAISEGLSTNTTLHTLKIGRNRFHDYGVHKLLKEIRKQTSSALKHLDMDDTTLDQACLRELEMLTQERAGFTCQWGTVIKGGGPATSMPASLRRNAPQTPIVVQKFLSFVNSRGWRLIDLFRIITRNDFSALRMTVDRERFVQGLQRLGVRLRKVQLDELFDILDIDEDGVVRFQEFVAMKQMTR
ncbi:uncharacterized protein LOC144664153 [Oculina patagonica]